MRAETPSVHFGLIALCTNVRQSKTDLDSVLHTVDYNPDS